MRNLTFADVFTVLQVIDKANLSRQLQAFARQAQDEKLSDKELGLKFAMTILGGLGQAKNEVAQLFADLTEKSKEEILNLDLEQTYDLFVEFAELEGLKGFLLKVLNMRNQ